MGSVSWACGVDEGLELEVGDLHLFDLESIELHIPYGSLTVGVRELLHPILQRTSMSRHVAVIPGGVGRALGWVPISNLPPGIGIRRVNGTTAPGALPLATSFRLAPLEAPGPAERLVALHPQPEAPASLWDSVHCPAGDGCATLSGFARVGSALGAGLG